MYLIVFDQEQLEPAKERFNCLIQCRLINHKPDRKNADRLVLLHGGVQNGCFQAEADPPQASRVASWIGKVLKLNLLLTSSKNAPSSDARSL